MKYFLVGIDEKKTSVDPEMLLRSLVGVKRVEPHELPNPKNKPIPNVYLTEGKPLSKEQLELSAIEMEQDTEWVELDEAREKGLKLINQWRKVLKK